MVPSREDVYSELDKRLTDTVGVGPGFTQLVATSPAVFDSSIIDNYSRRLEIIRRFQRTSILLFRESLASSTSVLTEILLNDCPEHWRINYHRGLREEHWTTPVYFRTDEADIGRIVEIQCPGSLWGDYELLRTFYAERDPNSSTGISASEGFSESLSQFLGAAPIVHHLVDNASAPYGCKYFIAMTRPKVAYFGYDRGIKQLDCNFVRSHSFFGLMAENFSAARLDQCADGMSRFDLPPHVLFDQKATLALPFWRNTAHHYDDEIRSILAYTQFVEPSGFVLAESGQWITLEQFSRLPRSRRRYFLKYAGCDVAINWGSRAVYDLSRMSSAECLARLLEAAEGFSNGPVWVVQEAIYREDDVEYYAAEGRTERARMHAKYSGFYGPGAFLGGLIQYRRFYKVHGQSDTIAQVMTGK